VKLTTDKTASALCAALREALDYFGGVPAELLLDNAKSVVIERDAYGAGLRRWNTELLRLAETCGLTPRLCRPCAPQKYAPVDP
jgi:transposase